LPGKSRGPDYDEIREVALKSLAILQDLGPKIQWLHREKWEQRVMSSRLCGDAAKKNAVRRPDASGDV